MKTNTCPNSPILYPTSYFRRAKLSFVEKVIRDEYGVDSNETLEYATGKSNVSYLEMLWDAQDWYEDTYKEEGCDSLERMREIIIEAIENEYVGIQYVSPYVEYFPKNDILY